MSILDNLIHHFKLDETGALDNRNDAVGSAQLVPNGVGITGVAGKVGNAPDFPGNSFIVMSSATVADFTTEDFTIAFWVLMDAIPPTQSVPLSKWFSTGRQYQFDYLASSSRFRFLTRNAADNANYVVSADNFGAPSTATWYFIVLQRDTGANEISIRVNNGTRDTLSADDLPSQTTKFAIGKRDGDPTTLSADAHKGHIDEISIWDRLTTDDEETTIYNAGAGLAYPWGAVASPASGTDGSLRAGGESKLYLPPTLVLP